jgi:hypothetical protein
MGVLIGLAVGIPVGILILVFRHRAFVRNMPDGGKRRELIASIQEMKEMGDSHEWHC